MALSTRFLQATASAATLSMAAGCATMGNDNNPVEYNTIPSDQRTANARISRDHVRLDSYGNPTPIEYDACRAYQRTLRAMGMPAEDARRAALRGTKNIERSVIRGDGVGRAAVGAGVGVGLTVLSHELIRILATPAAKEHEGNCYQQNVHDSWARDHHRWTREFQRCMNRETRGRDAVDPQTAQDNCAQTVIPVTRFWLDP